MELSLAEIARLIEGNLEGDGDLKISNIAKIEEADEGEISFIANPKYAKFIDSTNASAVIVSEDFPTTTKAVIRSKNPYLSFLILLKHFYPDTIPLVEGIHPSAVIDKSARIGQNPRIGASVIVDKGSVIGDNAVLYPGVVIGAQTTIGNNTVIHPNVVIRDRMQIGNNVIIHSGTVIGSDGFGFAPEGEKYQKIPQVGIVVIEDNVEIGANCAIDRATIGKTIIRKGAKLDNLIQVAHNVVIGENTVIAAQTGISGSTKIGRNCIIAGQVGFAGHLEIGDNVTVAAQTGVSKNLESGAVYFGYPARPIMQAKREEASIRKLPALIKKISELESRLKDLEK